MRERAEEEGEDADAQRWFWDREMLRHVIDGRALDVNFGKVGWRERSVGKRGVGR